MKPLVWQQDTLLYLPRDAALCWRRCWGKFLCRSQRLSKETPGVCNTCKQVNCEKTARLIMIKNVFILVSLSRTFQIASNLLPFPRFCRPRTRQKTQNLVEVWFSRHKQRSAALITPVSVTFFGTQPRLRRIGAGGRWLVSTSCQGRSGIINWKPEINRAKSKLQ